jgi:hypothetical protein
MYNKTSKECKCCTSQPFVSNGASANAAWAIYTATPGSRRARYAQLQASKTCPNVAQASSGAATPSDAQACADDCSANDHFAFGTVSGQKVCTCCADAKNLAAHASLAVYKIEVPKMTESFASMCTRTGAEVMQKIDQPMASSF